MPRSEQRAEVMTLLSCIGDKYASLADDFERVSILLGQIDGMQGSAPRWLVSAKRYRADLHTVRRILAELEETKWAGHD